jgi:hypothetical protein
MHRCSRASGQLLRSSLPLEAVAAMLIRTLSVVSFIATAALAQTASSPAEPTSSAPGSVQPSSPASASTTPEEDPHPSLRVGLMLGLISVPRPVNVELHAKLWDWIGLGVSYTYLPSFISDWLLKLYNIDHVSLTSSSWEVGLRVYPFRGSFLLGANLGVGNVHAVTTGSQQAASADVTSAFVTPRLGWLWIWNSGFSLSTDAGVQIPLGNPQITFEPPQFRDYKPLRDAAENVGKSLVPVLNFRIGYFF